MGEIGVLQLNAVLNPIFTVFEYKFYPFTQLNTQRNLALKSSFECHTRSQSVALIERCRIIIKSGKIIEMYFFQKCTFFRVFCFFVF